MADPLQDSITIRANAPTYNTILLTARLAIISLCMGVVVYYQAKFGRLGDYIPALAPVAITYLLTIIYALYQNWGSNHRRFAYFQLLIDQFLITWIVYSTGGLNSPFTFMYVLVIVASFFYGRAFATYALAGMSTLLFSGLVVSEYMGYIRPYYPFPPLADPKIFYYAFISILVNTLSFIFVAVMSSQIAGLLRKTGQELAKKIEDFTMLQAFHENVLNNMSLGFMAIGLDKSVLSANPAAERILGVRSEEIIRKPADNILQLSEIEEFLNNISASEKTDKRFQWVYKAPESDEVFLSMSLSKFAVGGEIQGAIAVFEDITELKVMERSMAESERMAAVGKVAAVIAHEIRNPLASLSGSIQMLSSDLSSILDENNTKLMNITLREADRLSNIITEFLEYSSPRKPHFREAGLDEILNELVTLLKSGSRLPDSIEIQINAEPGLRAMMDPERVTQVLWNIVLNAVDAMPNGGKLMIEAYLRTDHDSVKGKWIRISLEDSGEGMTKDTLDNIFEPFFTTKTRGTGLGLPSARKIMRSHGGEIEAKSTLGKGSCFVLWLPAMGNPEQLTTDDSARSSKNTHLL
ncbi:MAG: ATP-binding protein [Nitrospinota bacterium]|nr:ATP-binding protein [Nitrospinota bacterium]